MGGTIVLYVKPNGRSIIDLDDTDYLYAKIASNARHHPPAAAVEDESRAIAGRVHAVVRCVLILTIQSALDLRFN